jgi:hypothetical protein
MQRFRFSITMLLMVVAFCGLGLAALRAASGYWAALLVTLALIALLFATVAAVVGERKAPWIGFAIFGWGYAVIGLGPWGDVRAFLFTTVAASESYPYVHKAPFDPVKFATLISPGRPGSIGGRAPRTPIPKYFEAVPGHGPTRILTSEQGNEYVMIESPSYYAYMTSAQAHFTILFGFLGAVVAAWIAERRDQVRQPTSNF